MIQVHKDAHGNITGYFNTELNQWVPPPTAIEVLDQLDEVLDEANATDADDAQEPAEYDWGQLTVAQLKTYIKENGGTPTKNATKDQLIEQAKDCAFPNK